MDTYKGVWIAANQRTCIVTAETKRTVTLVMTEATGVEVFTILHTEFTARFKRLHGHSMESAARSMFRYGALVGVSDEARSELHKVIPKEEETMAKRALPRSIPSLPKGFTEPPAPADPKPKGGTVTVKVHPPPKLQKPKRRTMEQVVKEMKVGDFINTHLLQGKETDEIFEACQLHYPGFGKKQRNTINVYRHRLRAAGKLK